MDIEKIIADANATGNPVTRATYDAFVRLGQFMDDQASAYVDKLEAAVWGPRQAMLLGQWEAEPLTVTRVDWNMDPKNGNLSLQATGTATVEGIRALAAQFSTPYDRVTLNGQTYAMLRREAFRALARRTTRKHQRGHKARRSR